MSDKKRKMAQQWTNEYSILRDLSVAQGRVPVAIEGTTVGAGDKPPSLNITEETEEDFFKHCSGDADVTAAPDLGLIKKMLDMVRDINVSSDEEDLSKAVVISKLNPQSAEFVPKTNNTSTPINEYESPKELLTGNPKKNPKKRQRNIAVESILQSIADNKNSADLEAIEPMKLLKPNDFIHNNVMKANGQNDQEIDAAKDKTFPLDDMSPAPTALEKVNGWFKTQTDSPFPKKTPKVTLEATNMFKKKSVMEKAKINIANASTIKSPTSSNSGEYKPSVMANEYYKKYAEQSKFKESIKDDIWTKAEKKMKEIDEKRKSERAEAQASHVELSQDNDTLSTKEMIVCRENNIPLKMNRCLDLVCLPMHRHLLPGDCIVCEVMTKKTEPKLQENKEQIDTNLDISAREEMSAVDNVVETESNVSDNFAAYV